MDGAVDVHEPEERLVAERDRVVSEVPELDVGDAEISAAASASFWRSALTRSRVMPCCRQSLADSPRSPKDRQITVIA